MSEYSTKIKIAGPCAKCNEPLLATIDLAGCFIGQFAVSSGLKKGGFDFETLKQTDGYLEMITCKSCVAKAKREREAAKEADRKQREKEKADQKKLKAAAKLLAGLSEDQRRALLEGQS